MWGTGFHPFESLRLVATTQHEPERTKGIPNANALGLRLQFQVHVRTLDNTIRA